MCSSARLPGWPPEIAADLEEGASRDIRDLQAQLERNVEKHEGRTGSDRATSEALLRVLRDNRLTAILDPGFNIDQLFGVRVETAPTKRVANTESVALPPTAANDPALAPRTSRRIVIDY